MSLLLALVVVPWLISVTNGCSMPLASEGTYFINDFELLDTATFPDSLFLRMARTDAWWADYQTLSWCKVMDVHTGSVSDAIYNCSSYDEHLRDSAVEDTDPFNTSVTCYDNCNGWSARCTITRGGETYEISSVRYNDSVSGDTVCPSDAIDLTTFTLHSMNTTIIVFSSNTKSIVFNSTTGAYWMYDVVQEGDNWSYLNPSHPFADRSPRVFSELGVIQLDLPCCLCYGHSTNVFSIETHNDTMTQNFNISLLTYGGRVDDEQSRVIQLGLNYPDGVTLWDVSDIDSGVDESYLEPDLCDAYVASVVSPCDGPIACTTEPDAECVEDYCGGCYARWIITHPSYYEEDVTTSCHNATVYRNTTMTPEVVHARNGVSGRSGVEMMVAMSLMMLFH